MRGEQKTTYIFIIFLFSALFTLPNFAIVRATEDSWIWVENTVTGAWGEAVVGTGDAIYIARQMSFYRYHPINGWTTLANPPNPDSGDTFKTGTALAWDFGDYIYALYGAATSDSRRWFYRYSISGNSWTILANTTANQGEGDSLTCVGESIYATIGGEQRPTYFIQYNPSTNLWSDTPSDPPAGMGDGASLIWTGGEFLYALRGEDDETSPIYDFWRYSLSSDTWTSMANIPADPQEGQGGVGDGGSLLYIGSWLTSQTDYIYALSGNQVLEEPDNRTYRYTISVNKWERLAGLPFNIGYYVGCRLGYAGEHIYAWQGTPSTWPNGGDDLAKYEFSSVLSLEQVTDWYWTDNTTINDTKVGDVDNDGSAEIVTGGNYFDGSRDVAQLVVWDGTTLSVDRLTTWYWTNHTRINSIAIGNLDEDEALEIVTGGYYYDNNRKIAQLVVWDGSTLAVEGIRTWYWTGDTEINSVKIADIKGDGSAEIITGGYFNDGFRDVAQLVVWNSTALDVVSLTTWYWSGDTRINSIATENVDEDNQLEIVTGGYYTNGRRIAQLVVWDGLSLTPDNIASWYWTSDTEINSVVAANVDDDTDVEIITGGYFNDNTRDVAQLVVWSNDLQTVENLATWYWTGDTRINSIEVGDVDSDGSAEIVTGGYFNDLTRHNAQLVVWDASTLNVDYLTSWYWTSDTCICSVAIGNVDGDIPIEIITGGYFNDATRNCAQTTIWEID